MNQTGSSDISLRKVAQLAGVSPTATYRHFASKDALLIAIAEEGFARLESYFEQAQGDFQAFGEAYIRFARENPAIFKLLFGGEYTVSELGDGQNKPGQGAYQYLIEKVSHHMQLPREDPRVLKEAIAAWSLVHGYAMLLLDDRLPDEAQSDAFISQFLNRK